MNLPEPPVPPDLDLRGFHYMALDVVRLRDSRFALETTGDEFRAGVLLWCASWHQKPASSLPNDDTQLASLAGFGRDVEAWKRVREGALRGFILCSDGRLHHPVLAEKALQADAVRGRNRARTAAATVARKGKRDDERHVVRDGERHVVRDDVRGDHQRNKGKENKQTEKRTVRNSNVEELSLQQIEPGTTTTTVSNKASQGKANRGKLIGTQLPTGWTPDEALRANVLTEFGMTFDDIKAELPTFHALNAQNGTLSRDWGSTFFIFAKRWKERQIGERSKRIMPDKHPSQGRFEPQSKDWDSHVKFWIKTGIWSHQFGPEPGMLGCRCPEHNLITNGVDPKTGTKLKQIADASMIASSDVAQVGDQ
jgi:hypothetical protein